METLLNAERYCDDELGRLSLLTTADHEVSLPPISHFAICCFADLHASRPAAWNWRFAEQSQIRFTHDYADFPSMPRGTSIKLVWAFRHLVCESASSAADAHPGGLDSSVLARRIVESNQLLLERAFDIRHAAGKPMGSR